MSQKQSRIQKSLVNYAEEANKWTKLNTLPFVASCPGDGHRAIPK